MSDTAAILMGLASTVAVVTIWPEWPPWRQLLLAICIDVMIIAASGAWF